ncbi:MAG: hypothetical protein Q8911_13975 [Bacillota bacterium]|nr:hypothetical protein [Bacillota bacterium]
MNLVQLVEIFKVKIHISEKNPTLATMNKLLDFIGQGLCSPKEIDPSEVKEEIYRFLTEKFPKFTGRSKALRHLHSFWDAMVLKAYLDVSPIRDVPRIILEDQTFRCLEILKIIQSDAVSDEELGRRLLVGESQIREDMRLLQNGIELPGGFNVQIEETRKHGGKRKFFSSSHPVFAAFNLLQLFQLYRHIDMLTEDDPAHDILHYLGEVTCSQLTDYARERLKVNGIDIDRYSKGSVTRNIRESEWKTQDIINHAYKSSGLKVFVVILEDGQEIRLEGTVVHYWDREDGDWFFRLKTGDEIRTIFRASLVRCAEIEG